MIKKEKIVDFYTTGRQLSEQEFAHISEWIKKDKEKQFLNREKQLRGKNVSPNKIISAIGTNK